MNPRWSACLLFAMTTLVTGSSPAAPPATEGVTAGGAAMSRPAFDGQALGVDRASLTPMHREILDVVESERASIEALQVRVTQAALPEERLAIHKEIEAVKKAGMIAVLEIQIRYARAEGHSEAAQRLEAAVEELRHPRPTPPRSQPTLLEQAGAQ